MAKQKGPIRIEGSLGELSFYSSVFGDIVRRKGGASKHKIRKSPAFARLRNHQAEFKGCVAAAKLMRQALLTFTRRAPDFRLVGRVNKLMHQLKTLDSFAVEGERTVSAGLKTESGKRLVETFELNSEASLERNCKKEPLIYDGEIQLKGLIPQRDLKGNKAATHAVLTGIILKINFEKNFAESSFDEVTLNLDNKKQEVTLQPKIPKGKGFVFYLLQIQYVNKGNITETFKEGCSLTVLMVE